MKAKQLIQIGKSYQRTPMTIYRELQKRGMQQDADDYLDQVIKASKASMYGETA
jgi:hypothetical protein